jgi:two-component system, LuxR family, response regulator FixJ
MDCEVKAGGQLFVVDDDPAVLAALKFTFEADGYTVTSLVRGEDLIRLHPFGPRACIVIDQRLSGLTGIETLSYLRDIGVATPAVLITTHPSKMLRRRASDLGLDIVEKPLLGDDLSCRVAHLIELQ